MKRLLSRTTAISVALACISAAAPAHAMYLIPGSGPPPAPGPMPMIRTVLGGGVGDGYQATTALLSSPAGMAYDASGNLYVADKLDHRVRRIGPDGVITTVAGNGTVGYSNNAPAVGVRLHHPQDVVIDSARHLLYEADRSTNRVRRVNLTSGAISDVTGDGKAGYNGDGIPASVAQLNAPYGVALDSAGNLFIADTGNNRVRRIDVATGIITTVAGRGTKDFGGDGAPATAAGLMTPSDVEVDSAGNLYIAQPAVGRVRKVDALTGIISNFAGSTLGYAGDGGAASAAKLSKPYALAVANATGSVYIAEQGNNDVRVVNGAGIISTYATGAAGGEGVAVSPTGAVAWSSTTANRVYGGSGSGSLIAGTGDSDVCCYTGDGRLAKEGRVGRPRRIAFDPAGNAFVTEFTTGALTPSRIRRVHLATGLVSTFAGGATSGFSGDGGPATSALLNQPDGVAAAGGNVYIADTGNNRIRVVDGAGVITTLAIPIALNAPADLAVSGGALFIADVGNNVVRRLDLSTGAVSTVAGNGLSVFSGDEGPAVLAGVVPSGIGFDGAGRLLIADATNDRVRRVDLSTGTISTIAGLPTVPGGSYGGDDGQAKSAQLFDPTDVAGNAVGAVFIADTGNHRVRWVSTGGKIMTYAGTGITAYNGDDKQAKVANLYAPAGVSVSPSGEVWVADTLDDRVRAIA